MQGTVDLVNGKDDDNGKAAQLGSGFWLNVTKSDAVHCSTVLMM